jgi:hypothetical protein
VYGLDKILTFKESFTKKSGGISVENRLLFIKFMVECVIGTTRFKQNIDSLLEKIKMKERERNEKNSIARKRGVN